MSERLRAGGWSLRGKILQSLGITTLAVSIATASTGIWFVTQAAHREVEALLQEELDEVKAAFSLAETPPEEFEPAFVQFVSELSKSHPGASFAWRVWSSEEEAAPREYGDLTLLVEGAPSRAPLDQSFVMGNSRWRSIEMPGGQVVGLILDEEPHFQLVRQFGTFALVFLLVVFAGIFLIGLGFANRVSGLLSKVANEVRHISGPSDEMRIQRSDLPREVSDVVDALDEMLRNIREETQSTRLLIAGTAHELRSPLQNLVGEAEVALLAERSPESYRAVLASQLEELRDLGDAVQNLLALCSAKRAAAADVEESFELDRELEFRLAREQQRAAREGITLTQEARGDMRLRGDREALVTGLRNLVSNALDWTPRGGRVEVHCEEQGREIVVTVRDTGPGIPATLVPSLFEPFVRGEAAVGKRIGYGLGLALARSAAEAQGGSIEVAERDAPGACFRVVLPRERPPRATD